MNISVISRLFFSMALVVINAFTAGGNHTIANFQGPNNNSNTTITTAAAGRVFLPFLSTPRAYYVSPGGSDSNPGTMTLPWRTITKAGNSVVPGDTVYVRGGTYPESVTLSRSGSPSGNITIQAYPNEKPVITGNSLSMSSWGSLVSISGSYITFSGFEVSNSRYIGIIIKGTHDVVDNAFSHHNQGNGILIAGDYSTVQNSRVWRNVLSNEYGKAGRWDTGLSAARDTTNGITDNAVIRNNTVWENWGEGISSFEANGTVIEGNISHDNYSANIYVSDSTNVLVQDNLVYMDNASYVFGSGANVGIMMGDEKYTPASANITVINNIAYNNHRNFFWWKGNQEVGMNNVLIAYNTFVNGCGDGSNGNSNVIIGAGTHQNVRFMDNIVQQDSAIPLIGTKAQEGITYSHNLWSRAPLSAAAGAGDVIANPLLAKAGSTFSSQYYALTGSSPAINKGISLSEVLTDFARATRGSPSDIGALEYR